MSTPAPAGWYPDNAMPGTQRYWDGSTWTPHVAPVQQAQARPPVAGNMTIGSAVLLAILIPLAGLIMGCIELARGQGGRGALLLLVGLVSIVAWGVALSALA